MSGAQQRRIAHHLLPIVVLQPRIIIDARAAQLLDRLRLDARDGRRKRRAACQAWVHPWRRKREGGRATGRAALAWRISRAIHGRFLGERRGAVNRSGEPQQQRRGVIALLEARMRAPPASAVSIARNSRPSSCRPLSSAALTSAARVIDAVAIHQRRKPIGHSSTCAGRFSGNVHARA